MRRTRTFAAASWIAAGMMAAAAAAETTAASEIDEIRQEIARLRAEHERRIGDLERRLAALEADDDAPAAERPAPGELDELRAAAREAAAQVADAAATATSEAPVGRERNLNRLNPEISATGIFLASSVADDREEFEVQEMELDLQAALDPFSRTRFTLAVHEGEVELEEGWVQYSGLPGGLGLTAGRFRQRFGPLNRQHRHALPQTDFPLVYQTLFGDEGLAQTGLSLAWLLPRPWASSNEVVLEITNSENETAFSGESFDELAVLGRLKNYWDLSDAAYLEWGVSGIAGTTADGGDSRIFGTDLTLSWQPPARAKYRSLTWRTELLRSERDLAGLPTHTADGGYSYLEGLVARNLSAGLRLDWAEDPLDAEIETRGVSPYLTWWQSEYVRLRAEYNLLEDRLSGRTDNRFRLQLTWAAGPHKHESY